MKKYILGSIGVILCLVGVYTSQGIDIVYANNQALVDPPGGVVLDLVNGQTVGNTITLAPATPRNIVQFAFEYFASPASGTSFAGTPTLDFQLYLNNGSSVNGVASPGTSIYNNSFSLNSAVAPVSSGGVYKNLSFLAADFPAGGVVVSGDTLTWSVEVTGLSTGDQFGLVAFDPGAPGNVGTASDYYWLDNGSWQPYTNSVTGANSFGVEVWAQNTSNAPEQGNVLPVAISGFVILAVLNRRQRQHGDSANQ